MERRFQARMTGWSKFGLGCNMERLASVGPCTRTPAPTPWPGGMAQRGQLNYNRRVTGTSSDLYRAVNHTLRLVERTAPGPRSALGPQSGRASHGTSGSTRDSNLQRVYACLALITGLTTAAPAAAQESVAEADAAQVSASAAPPAAAPSVDVGLDDEQRALAKEPALPIHGFQWGLKLGLELPVGSADDGLTVAGQQLRSGELSGFGSVRVPIGLDLGYRLNPEWWLGLEAGAGVGPVGDDCPSAANCEWSSLRLGAQAIAHLDPYDSLDPWLGVVVGYEWLRSSVGLSIPFNDDDGFEQTAVAKARELLGGPQVALQGGLNFSLGNHLALGPFATAAAGMYLTNSYDCPPQLPCPDSGNVESKRVHAWLGIGVRGTHGP